MKYIVDDLISVIVPVYNSEKDLRKCVDSIINQTYYNIEIILVDDGSSDSSPSICDEYSKLDDRVVVIHKENGGVSSARNTGLKTCKGDYISFVDSDDYIHPEFLEVLYTLIKKDDYSISQCCSRFVTNHNYSELNIYNITDIDYEVINKEEALYRCVKKSNALYYCIACDKLFSRSVAQNILFPEIVNAEDVKYCIDTIYQSDKIIICNKKLYYYYKHSGSATTSSAYLSDNLIKVFDYFDDKCKKLINDDIKIFNILEASHQTKMDAVLEDYWNAFRLKDKNRIVDIKQLYEKMKKEAYDKGYKFRKKSIIYHLSPVLLLFLRYIYMLIKHS